MITREKALTILNEKLQNKNLVRHCLAVEAAMKALAKYFQADEEKWGIVGLLHDGDWEATKDNFALHAKLMIQWLKQAGENDQEIIKAILSHNFINNGEKPPQTPMEWALYTCDELTGLIVAVALVMPDKKLSSVTVESVLKKFSSKSFAAGANRLQIKMAEEKLGIKLPDFIGIVLRSMQAIASDLGL